MKHFLFSVIFIFLCLNQAEAQTNANISGPENVLVVYKQPSSPTDTLGWISDSIKNYYQNSRGIPEINIVPLNNLISHNITVDGSTHNVIIAEGGNIIRDSINHINGTWFATPHAWKYFYQYLALPIKQHLINNNLTTTIKYIVLCKGTPFYIQAACDSTNVIANLAIDGLLAMLGTNNYDILLDSIYNKYRSYAINGDQYYYSSQPQIKNPYFTENAYLNMNNRFHSGVFDTTWNGHNIKLDFLVSHLDGINYNMVKGMIDRSTEAVNASNYDWFIDADPSPCHGGSVMIDFANYTASYLSSIGFTNYSFDYENDTVTYHNKPIISYSSNGVHTTNPPNIYEGQTLHPDYIQTQLNFNYTPGAIFNTAESFNAWRLSSVTRASAPMGQLVEFFLEGGTVGVGHANEPFVSGIIRDYVMFPSYQVGYTFIDAAYMGMKYLGWQNVILGDPLTTIAWGKQSLTSNLNWSGTNLVTGEIDITNYVLSIANNSIVNLKHQGFVTGEGRLIIGQNVTFNIYDWQKGLFLSYDSDNPRLVWGAHPTLGSGANYRVYRKFGVNGSWVLITTTSAKEYKDLQMQFSLIGDEADNLFYKVVAFSELPGTYESNIVACTGNKAPKKIKANQNLNSPVEYSLEQNYPNPFNPTTQINYSIKETGLVQLKVYDILGKEVATLVNKNQEAGNYSASFDASNLSSGIYLYKLQSGEFVSSKKMILIK